MFFGFTTTSAVIGCPWYVGHYGITGSELLLFGFYLFVTGMSITAGYHRLFSHAAYKSNPLVQFFFLFFGAAAFEQSALRWSSQHRDHHRYVDTEQDPYSIKKGFFYAHIGWLIFWEHDVHYENVHDLRKNKMVMSQHQHYLIWAIGSGILVPVAIGALSGHALGAFLFSVCLRLTLVYHSTFFINSACHTFGKATYDIAATAKDSWFVALITNGEGYHNFHHRFPSDYRNGVCWYQWDPTKWMIAFLGKLRLARDLKKISVYRIIEAKLSADNQRIQNSLKQSGDFYELNKAFEGLRLRHEKIKQSLVDWEVISKLELKDGAFKKIELARRRFREMHEQWLELIHCEPFKLCQILSSGLSV